MEVYECVQTRRTVRNFKPDPLPEDLVFRIVQAGRWAPSSSNSQPWHFIVVQNRDTLTALGEIASQGRFIAQAP
ncbi:MAG: nitroreductase family protein, partial [Chloroflexi bacterium]|nr:nitroreductase family protein [Chloroflexota bacterium]